MFAAKLSQAPEIRDDQKRGCLDVLQLSVKNILHHLLADPLGTNQVLISSQVEHAVGQHHHLQAELFKSPRLDNFPDFSQMGSWVHQIADRFLGGASKR